MEKATHREASNVSSMNGNKGAPGQDDLAEIILSVSSLVSREMSGIMEDVSKALPKVTAQFLRKHWKPAAISAAAGVAAGVGAYVVIQKVFTGENRKSFLNLLN